MFRCVRVCSDGSLDDIGCLVGCSVVGSVGLFGWRVDDGLMTVVDVVIVE